MILGIIYRPPQSPIDPFIEDFDKALMHIGRSGAKAYVAGDFNVDISSYPKGQKVRRFVNTLITHSFFPIVNKATRVIKTTCTLIDNFIANKSRLLF